MKKADSITPPVLECCELPVFTADNLNVVRAAFQVTSGCPLGQAWQLAPETDFNLGHVSVGWRENSLLVFAELADADIFSHATAHNQRMWELGDTFEIFLHPEDSGNYVEFHVTPDNWRLQLSFPDSVALRRAQVANDFASFLLPDGAFHSQVWKQPEYRKWFVYVEIPSASVCGVTGSLAESRWRFSFSRYEHTRGRQTPILSSTSPHPVPDFHRREDWGTLRFVPAAKARKMVKPQVQIYGTA